ncbi:MAG: branched-chain amino acid transport system substrate-binding protein, partial [Rubritalea sp.]
MKKLLLALAVLATLSALFWAIRTEQPAPVAAKDINVGIILGFTGPIESLTPTMAASAEL